MIESLERYEISILLTAIKDLYHYDFSDYRTAYLLRRVHRRMEMDGHSTITELTSSVIHDEKQAMQFIRDLSINVTSMFRQPEFFKELRDRVFPVLRTYPTVNIWIAGCATGEEVLSLAILLKESDLYDRTKILATDINRDAMEKAAKALYTTDSIKQWTKNYSDAGGRQSFTDYYSVKYNFVQFEKRLLDNVTFEYHDLTTNVYPDNMNMIICRNVLIYFNETLQNHTTDHFHDSLKPKGYLGLGEKERLMKKENQFVLLNRDVKLYQKND